MTLHVCVLGIDGSGKSTATAALPAALAGETGETGETFHLRSPDEDHLAPKFHPEGLPLSARLAGWFKKAAR